MAFELSRRHLLEASGAVAAAALLPTLPAAPPQPALDLEALFSDYPMSKVLLGMQSGSYLSSGGALIANFLKEDGRFNITHPLRLALAQILSDGKDILFHVDEPDDKAHLRDAMVVHLFRRFGVPGFMRYGEVDFEPGPAYRPVLGVYGTLIDAPDQKVMLLTQDSDRWQVVRREGRALPPFESCVLV